MKHERTPPTQTVDELLTVAELAERWRVPENTIRRWSRAGKLPAFKIGDVEWRFSADDLQQFLTERKAASRV